MSDDSFYLLPEVLAKREDLTPTHKIVLAVLIRLQGYKSCCYPSLNYIASAIGMSRSQTIRVINDLAKRNEIIRFRHTRKSNTYSVPWATARNLRRSWAIRRSGS